MVRVAVRRGGRKRPNAKGIVYGKSSHLVAPNKNRFPIGYVTVFLMCSGESRRLLSHPAQKRHLNQPKYILNISCVHPTDRCRG